MSGGGLRAHPWRIAYGPADDRLREFYIPALSRSVAYARSAGYFTSSALVVAATGIAHLIRNGGTMRLLVGAKLMDDDAHAIEEGYDLRERLQGQFLAVLDDPVDALQRRRLESLAWMIARGTLDIRVVVPLVNGKPIATSGRDAYYHVKHGFFRDAAGDVVGFSGSVNESVTAWERNYEELLVFKSWPTDEGDTRAHLQSVIHRFERLWAPPHTDADWVSVAVPQAVLDKLVQKYEPDEMPDADPLEKPKRVVAPVGRDDQDERILFRFVKDAPRLVGARRLGARTAPFDPWPHQVRVAEAVTARYPEGFLLCDEVGLGKSIELGLILRQLFLDGRVKRALILTPASIRWQLQQEMYEKFVLDVPVYDEGVFVWRDGRVEAPSTENHWEHADLFIASSQLAKRKDRRNDVIGAKPWDLLVVDEAHHARRKDFQDSTQDRPNNLLDLLRELRRQHVAKCVLLMTATPMQVHPVEVFDLLQVLGVGGRWGATPDGFLDFFKQLRMPRLEDVDWGHVVAMVRDARETGVEIEPKFRAAQERRLGPVGWKNVEGVLTADDPDATVRKLSDEERRAVVELCRHLTPLRTRIQRNTRALLRKYLAQGLLPRGSTICTREPEPVWVDFTEPERLLYGQVETYISRFYKRYEATRKGLGFVMTVYRKRLTSSFFALQCSLERRLEFLRGKRKDEGFDADDVEQDQLEFDVDEDVLERASDEAKSVYDSEIGYVEGFLREIAKLGEDSKLVCLREQIEQALRKCDSLIVFTQYTDTMRYIRQMLVGTYGPQIACYSGRGGEVWDGTAWKEISKEELKARFRDGAELKILLGTESMSEGLNLQTCGVLFNFDMPWNPMRVEQRIGRIDRIGQKFGKVWIRHFFYSDSVEAEVYRRLQDRIGWFVDVVGELQPILAGVQQTIERAAMAAPDARAKIIADGIADAAAAASGPTADLPIDDYLDEPDLVEEPAADPVPLIEIGKLVLHTEATRKHFTSHPTIEGAYRFTSSTGTHLVTFDQDVFDRHGDSVRLMTFGEPLLAEVLAMVGEPDTASDSVGRAIRCRTDADLVGWFRADGEEAIALTDIEDLRARVKAPAAHVDEHAIDAARAAVAAAAAHEDARVRTVQEQIARGEFLARCEEARLVLRKAAAVDLVQRSRRGAGLFEDDVAMESPRLAVPADAVLHFARTTGAPFAPLLRLLQKAGVALPVLRDGDPVLAGLTGANNKRLVGHASSLRGRASELVGTLVGGHGAQTDGARAPDSATASASIIA